MGNSPRHRPDVLDVVAKILVWAGVIVILVLVGWLDGLQPDQSHHQNTRAITSEE